MLPETTTSLKACAAALGRDVTDVQLVGIAHQVREAGSSAVQPAACTSGSCTRVLQLHTRSQKPHTSGARAFHLGHSSLMQPCSPAPVSQARPRPGAHARLRLLGGRAAESKLPCSKQPAGPPTTP